MPNTLVEPKDSPFSVIPSWNLRGTLFAWDAPKVMGILNLTPDSFYDGGRNHEVSAALRQAEKHLQEGAHFLDLGGYSTRPGAAEVSEAEETRRVLPVVEALVREFPQALLSIDTFRSQVARQTIAAGAHIINDVSGGTLDAHMFSTVAQLQVPYILMHMRGTPQTMKSLAQYDEVVTEVVKELAQGVAKLTALGVADLAIDPGFGFAKTIGQNFEILRNLGYFKTFGYPVLAGLSRKSMIYRSLGISPDEALNGTTVLNTMALAQGAMILRVHDVKPALEAIKLVELTKP